MQLYKGRGNSNQETTIDFINKTVTYGRRETTPQTLNYFANNLFWILGAATTCALLLTITLIEHNMNHMRGYMLWSLSSFILIPYLSIPLHKWSKGLRKAYPTTNALPYMLFRQRRKYNLARHPVSTLYQITGTQMYLSNWHIAWQYLKYETKDPTDKINLIQTKRYKNYEYYAIITFNKEPKGVLTLT